MPRCLALQFARPRPSCAVGRVPVAIKLPPPPTSAAFAVIQPPCLLKGNQCLAVQGDSASGRCRGTFNYRRLAVASPAVSRSGRKGSFDYGAGTAASSAARTPGHSESLLIGGARSSASVRGKVSVGLRRANSRLSPLPPRSETLGLRRERVVEATRVGLARLAEGLL